MTEQANKQAKFDLSRVPLRWQRQLQKNFRTQAELEKENLTADDERRTDIAGEILDLLDEVERLLAMVLVDVPREYLHKTAPDEIDWSDPDSLGWLKSSDELIRIVGDLHGARRENVKN